MTARVWKGGRVTIEPPAPGEPRRPHGPRDPGDAWVVAASGERYWGRFGAAGLVVWDPASDAVLLQHRVGWSHFGGTWGLPGGARHEGEDATAGALREAHEEAGVPPDAVRAWATSVLDLRIWTYTTLIAEVITPFEARIADPESVGLDWVPVGEVEERELHPGFGAAWPALRGLLAVRPALVIDAANVVGSVPDGWWKDRAAATGRLRARVSALAATGIASAELGLGGSTWYPELFLVIEGAARAVQDTDDGVTLVRASGSGDDAIVDCARALERAGRRVTVVTSDRGLGSRLGGTAEVRGTGWLRGLLPPA